GQASQYPGQVSVKYIIPKKMPDLGNKFTRHHNFASCSSERFFNGRRDVLPKTGVGGNDWFYDFDPV
ncbi:MAG: hypothetical protein OXD29_14765, partial [Roseovarius sp.]|nr:hypothetical protein [Roseovarius sp.]